MITIVSNTPGDHDWVMRSRCHNEFPDSPVFWPETYETTPERREAARKLCRGCPVLSECADNAIKRGSSGVIQAGVPISDHGPRRYQVAALMFAREYNRIPTNVEVNHYMYTHDIPSWSTYGVSLEIVA